MSRAAIMSFLPFLSKIVPEPISKMEKGRYYRNRFVAISEVILRVIQLDLYIESTQNDYIVILYNELF